MTNRCAYCQADPDDPGKCILGACETCCNCGREIYDPNGPIHIPPKETRSYGLRRVDPVRDPLEREVLGAADHWYRLLFVEQITMATPKELRAAETAFWDAVKALRDTMGGE